jgi:hypothetical protein
MLSHLTTLTKRLRHAAKNQDSGTIEGGKSEEANELADRANRVIEMITKSGKIPDFLR